MFNRKGPYNRLTLVCLTGCCYYSIMTDDFHEAIDEDNDDGYTGLCCFMIQRYERDISTCSSISEGDRSQRFRLLAVCTHGFCCCCVFC